MIKTLKVHGIFRIIGNKPDLSSQGSAKTPQDRREGTKTYLGESGRPFEPIRLTDFLWLDKANLKTADHKEVRLGAGKLLIFSCKTFCDNCIFVDAGGAYHSEINSATEI